MEPGLPGPSGETPIWEEPVRGFYTDPGQFVTLSGLDLLRNMLEGGLGPPIRYLFGLAPTSVEPGGALVMWAAPSRSKVVWLEARGHQGERLSPDSGDLQPGVSWRTSRRSRPSASISASTP